MNLKIFRCRSCGAKVSWNATKCHACNRLVSNDRSKKFIMMVFVSLAVVLLFIVARVAFRF